MKFRFEVIVSLREGLLDPQGKTVEAALPTLGWSNVSEVRVGKHVDLVVEAESEEEARRQVEEMAAKFLSNPVIEDFHILDMEGPEPPPLEEARPGAVRALEEGP